MLVFLTFTTPSLLRLLANELLDLFQCDGEIVLNRESFGKLVSTSFSQNTHLGGGPD